ncbi:hypothetical protein [Clostridium sp.]|uniref:hypothetical protein n=1 Tax=Clostridium sp. TaxID=1506 RepID=UPI0025C376FB|nr:hypothetical protein [Clostridium sp.]
MKNSIGNFQNEKFNDFNGIIYDPKCMCIGSLGKGKHIRCFKLSELKKRISSNKCSNRSV